MTVFPFIFCFEITKWYRLTYVYKWHIWKVTLCVKLVRTIKLKGVDIKWSETLSSDLQHSVLQTKTQTGTCSL